MDNIFVTGASGFIGSRLISALSKMPVALRVLSRRVQGELDTVVCDLQCDKIPKQALAGIDTVFHLAGFSHDSRKATKVEHLYRAVNVNATIQLALLAVASGVKRFVFVSSVKAGGRPLHGKCISEADKSEPEGVYGRTKREAELKLLEIGKQSGMHISILRPALVYGVGVKGNLHKMLVAIRKKKFPPIPDTRNKRSMVHVEDVVKALILIAEKNLANGNIFNVTDDEQYSSRAVYDAMRSALGQTITVWKVPVFVFYVAAIIGDILNHIITIPFDSLRMHKLLGDECFSSAKIRSLLGFESCFTLYDSLSEMVEVIE
ncbi:UDP-glucose 4-epimerase [hydrothermal vent metagenome]|uniref:UDP-glucose 4-epimerase n=1 Tax=hydrothermal vent metagenome TaxID=652676 RepID=A0A3B0ZPK3_9ZZZZ